MGFALFLNGRYLCKLESKCIGSNEVEEAEIFNYEKEKGCDNIAANFSHCAVAC